MGRQEHEQTSVQEPHKFMLHNALKSGLAELTDRERAIIRLNFGLVPSNSSRIQQGEPKDVPLTRIATNLGLDVQSAHAIRAQGLEKISNNEQMARLAALMQTDESLRDAYKDDQFQPAVTLLNYVYKENNKPRVPARVRQKTWDFLQAAKRSGAFQELDDMSLDIIDTYYTTDATLEQTKEKVAPDLEKPIDKFILSILKKIWRNLPEPLQQEYPKDQTLLFKSKKGRKFGADARARISENMKDNPKVKENLQRLHKAQTGKPKSAETRAKISRTRRRQEEERRQRQIATQIFPTPEA